MVSGGCRGEKARGSTEGRSLTLTSSSPPGMVTICKHKSRTDEDVPTLLIVFIISLLHPLQLLIYMAQTVSVKHIVRMPDIKIWICSAQD